jgi:hypothetical protein
MSTRFAYVPHLLYSIGIVSLSMQTLWHRKEWEAQRSQAAAQISVLESVAQRLRSGERIDSREIARLRRMVRIASSSEEKSPAEIISPLPVLASAASAVKDAESYDQKDWEARTLLTC